VKAEDSYYGKIYGGDNYHVIFQLPILQTYLTANSDNIFCLDHDFQAEKRIQPISKAVRLGYSKLSGI
jgi:hypothetical protein